METFELWSYDVNGLGDLSEYAEHTYIRCPRGNEYFNCWGGHESDTQGSGIHRFSAQGLYDGGNWRVKQGNLSQRAGKDAFE